VSFAALVDSTWFGCYLHSIIYSILNYLTRILTFGSERTRSHGWLCTMCNSYWMHTSIKLYQAQKYFRYALFRIIIPSRRPIPGSSREIRQLRFYVLSIRQSDDSVTLPRQKDPTLRSCRWPCFKNSNQVIHST
jgi:hypothetical protein